MTTDLTRFDTGDDAIEPPVGERVRSLVDFLYPAPAKRDVPSILGWWEKRRLPYNLMVGSAGLVSTGVVLFFAAIPPFGSAPSAEIVIPIVVFGIMANVCYTLGSVVEILVHKIWGRDVLPVGPSLYRIGLTFSVGLALFPALLIVIIWVVRVVAALTG